MASTHAQRLAQLLLGEPVLTWVGDRREAGGTLRQIARDLNTATGGQVDVTPETIRLWLNEAETAGSDAA